MFDGLKDKLGKFRSDAEEAAEENVEELDEDDPDAVAEADAAQPADAGDEQPSSHSDGAASATESATDETAATDAASDADEAAGAAPDAGAASADETPADGDTASSADDDTEDADSTSFRRKAKNLAKGKFVIEEEDLEEPLWELEMALIESDVEMEVAEQVLDNIREELVGQTRTFTTSTGEVVEDALAEALHDVISVGQFDFEQRIAETDTPVVIVFTGVNGVGKTTSIAKLSNYLEQRGYSAVLANGDTYRAGANEQIQEHADALDKKCIAHEQGGDPAAVIYDAVEYANANDVDVVLGDTAGRLHTDEGLMDQLAKIDRVVDPDMTLFVDEAVAGQDAVNRAREFNDAAEIDGAILTKADADSQGGAAISVAHVTGKPILFLGVGQGYDDLIQFDPDELIDDLLDE